MLAAVAPLLALLPLAFAGVPASEIRLVAFDESYMQNQYAVKGANFNGFRHDWRGKCLQLCGAMNTHHNMYLGPLRKENTAFVECHCCPRDETTGGCYSKKHPYSKTSVLGPLTYITDQVIQKLQLDVIPASQINSVAVADLKIKNSGALKAGRTISFHWSAPKSEIGGTFYAVFKDSSSSVKVALNTRLACKIPVGMKGSVKVDIYSGTSTSSVYRVASTTIKVAGSSGSKMRRSIQARQRL